MCIPNNEQKENKTLLQKIRPSSILLFMTQDTGIDYEKCGEVYESVILRNFNNNFFLISLSLEQQQKTTKQQQQQQQAKTAKFLRQKFRSQVGSLIFVVLFDLSR
jgi:hypothetical protein